MWLSVLNILEKHGVTNVNFKGFMVDSAQTNINAVRSIFGLVNSKEPMEGKERSCQFHWAMALDQYTKQIIKPELQQVYLKLCHDYRKSQTKSDANTALAAIKAWWFSFGAVAKSSLKELHNLINFWHFRYHQWDSHISKVWVETLSFAISSNLVYNPYRRGCSIQNGRDLVNFGAPIFWHQMIFCAKYALVIWFSLSIFIILE